MALPTKQTKMNGRLWFTHSPQKIQRKNTHGNFQFQIKPIYFETCNKLLLRCILYIPSNWNVSIGSINGLTPASVKPFFEPYLSTDIANGNVEIILCSYAFPFKIQHGLSFIPAGCIFCRHRRRLGKQQLLYAAWDME